MKFGAALVPKRPRQRLERVRTNAHKELKTCRACATATRNGFFPVGIMVGKASARDHEQPSDDRAENGEDSELHGQEVEQKTGQRELHAARPETSLVSPTIDSAR